MAALPQTGDAEVRSSAGARTAYLEGGVFATLHPAVPPVRDLAVLLCPPFGWEEMCSYRVLREWANRLAASGITTLRFSLPGTGDSAGDPHTPELLDAWRAATDHATRWLREASGAQSIVAIGLGLGGMLAYEAAVKGSPVDGLVLWGTASRGRAVIRQLQVFSRMEAGEFYNELEPLAIPDDVGLEAGGYVLAPGTLAELGALDLTTLPRPRLPLGSLLLERDGLAVDGGLREALGDSDANCLVRPGDGWAAMTSHPQLSVVPEAVLAEVAGWLHSRGGGSASTASAAPPMPRLTVGHPASHAYESPWTLRTADGELRGILARPGDAPARLCAVFLNAGAQRRTGPNRMWLEASRRWLDRDVASLRLDMIGIGESDGPVSPYARDGALYTDAMAPRVLAALEALRREGVAERFLLLGLCAGAYWALDAGIESEAVAGIALVNPVAIVWDDGIGASRDLYRVFSERSWRLIRKNATPERMRAVLRLLLGMPQGVVKGLRERRRSDGVPPLERRIDGKLDRLEASGTRLLMMFAVREGLALDLRRTGRMRRLEANPRISIEPIPVNDHTVRAVAVQRLVHARLDAELDRVLTAEDGGDAATGSIGKKF